MEKQLTLDNQTAVLTRKCIKCGLEKILTEFIKSKVSKHGRARICRMCDSDYKRKWRESPNGRRYWENPEVRARIRAYNQTPIRRAKVSMWNKSLRRRIISSRKDYEFKIAALIILCRGKPRCMNVNCLVVGGCKDVRALHIDHIIAVGQKNRLESRKLYMWIVHNVEQARLTLQVLCANCNQIKKYEKGEGVKYSPLKTEIN